MTDRCHSQGTSASSPELFVIRGESRENTERGHYIFAPFLTAGDEANIMENVVKVAQRLA